MFWSKDDTFKKSKNDLDSLRINVEAILYLKGRKSYEVSEYLKAFDYFVEHPTEFDGATIVKDLVDICELDLDAMVHDYDYIHGANRNFIKKWKADIKYIKNMERNGKGIRIFRLLLLTIIGIVFVPYCFVNYHLPKG